MRFLLGSQEWKKHYFCETCIIDLDEALVRFILGFPASLRLS